MSLERMSQLTFEKPDMEKFPLLGFAFDAIARGGNMPCILNAANEVAVRAFLDEKISFPGMGKLARDVMDKASFIPSPTLEDLIATHAEATRLAQASL